MGQRVMTDRYAIEVTAELIQDLERQVAFITATPRAQQAIARRKRLYRVGAELKRRSDDLVGRMERGDAWLTAHPDHPKFREREDAWLEWEAEYRLIEDALERAQSVL